MLIWIIIHTQISLWSNLMPKERLLHLRGEKKNPFICSESTQRGKESEAQMSERSVLDGCSYSGLRPWPMRIVQKWCLNRLQTAWPWDSHLNGSPKGSLCVAYGLLSPWYYSITILFTCGAGSSKSLLWISIPALLMYACVRACNAVRMCVFH